MSHFVLNTNDYRQESIIGKGSFGQVVKSRNIYTGWPVAIKELYPINSSQKEIEAFTREIKIMMECHDTFLLNFVGYTQTPPYSIATEYMPLGSLWDLIHNSRERLNDTQKTNIAIGIAHGMRYLHHHKMIHRDLKSANILLDSQLLPRIADFGLSRFLQESQANLLTCYTGTPNWMAPEQFFSRDYSYPVDVFSYGMILYELLTSKLPWEGLDSNKIYEAITSGKRPYLSSKTPDQYTPLESLISICWRTNPKERPTFDYIYIQFATKNVKFPNADDSGIDELLHKINRGDLSHINPISKAAHSVNSVAILRDRLSSKHDNHLGNSLHKYAKEGRIADIIKTIKAADIVDLNITSSEKSETMLMAAASVGQFNCVRFLLGINHRIQNPDGTLSEKICLNSNLQNSDGNTALSLAAIGGYLQIIKNLLCVNDINVNIKNKAGKTALDLALENGHQEAAKILNQFMKTRNHQ